ncbi:MAG TPA: glycogen debranching N-terminal domain-containing protein [Candidatus Acidoferrales bacterium]|nr:glycogen debranching N-terminal domain-containing protein [Candidatus Acidoferrales bacterium]
MTAFEESSPFAGPQPPARLKPQCSLVRLRPRDDTLYVSQSNTVFATGRDGFVHRDSEHGLFVHETRLLSRYFYTIDGRLPHPVALSNVEQHSWLGYYMSLPPGVAQTRDPGSGHVQSASQQTLELRLSRYAGNGLHEDIDLTNFSQHIASFTLALEVDADFADIDEVRGARQQHGQVRREWREIGGAWELSFDYTAENSFNHPPEAGTRRLHRGLALRVENAASVPACREDAISFAIELAPQGTWHACIHLVPCMEGSTLQPLYRCRSFVAGRNEQDRRRRIFLNEATDFTGPDKNTLTSVVVGAVESAKRDLAALRLYDLDRSPRAWVPAAGLPIYVALFGRDSLTAAWQASLASPDIMKGTLPELACWQGAEVNDWRDEQPGRMLHEAHDGPMKVLDINPRLRYYGSMTTSGFYPVAVSELWHWTGDKELIGPLVQPAMKALAWLDRYGDLDGDGFHEYQSRSPMGVKNQAWKDSGDAVVYEDGSQVEPPIATCEEQGFYYLAKIHMSEVLWWLGDREDAKRLFQEAREFKKRFNEAFWMEDEGFFAFGLDAQKRQIRSIVSNPGHCLATAIVDDALVPRTMHRFLADDLFSGWGFRTLSSRHPAYDPYSYHRGSVWPVEQGTFAFAFQRYGQHDAVDLIARSMFEAAALFDFHRLPELFGGHPRDADHPFPALYPLACSPQAWSASSVFCLLQALLGLYPYAPLNILLVDPHMPDWLPEITLKGLRVGDAVATIRFFRTKEGGGDYEVLEKRGALHVIRQPSPWSLTASFADRIRDFLTSLLPGR